MYLICIAEGRRFAAGRVEGRTCPSCGARLVDEARAKLPPEDPDLPESVTTAARVPEQACGDFVLVERLGRGGMGVVWKAWQRPLSRWVALKLLSGEEAGDSERFLREARIAAGLHHPNIVPVYEVGETPQGKPYIAMQLVDGKPLSDARLSLRRTVETVRDCAHAIQYAHDRGIIHRDLKPQNVMLDAAGRPFVMDFGLARAVDRDRRLTATGELLGTPAFMAPEQASGGAVRVGPAADVYGLGATLYALLAGEPPFDGPSPVEVLRRVCDREPVSLRRRNARVPRDIETIVARAMEKEAGRRYATARAFAADLQRWLDGRAILARPAGPAVRAAKWVRRNRLLTAAILVAAAGLGALAVSGRLVRRSEAGRRQAEAALERKGREERERKERRDRAVPFVTRAASKVEEARLVLHQQGATVADMRALLEDAAAQIERALEIDDRNEEALFLRGRVRDLSGRREEALRDFDAALAIQPGHVAARVARIEILLWDYFRVSRARGMEKDAEERLADLARRTDADVRALEGAGQTDPLLLDFARALRHCARGTYAEAVEILADLIRRKSSWVELYKHRGDAIVFTAQFVKDPAERERILVRARDDYEEAIRRRAGYGEAYEALAGVYRSLDPKKWKSKILDAYERCGKIDPNDGVALSRHAQYIHFDLEDDRAALPVYARLREVWPRDSSVPLLMAVCRMALLEWDEAIRELDAALAIGPRSDARLCRATCLAMTKRYREAVEEYGRVVDDPEVGAFALLDRGVVRGFRLDDRVGEMADYDLALRRKPDLEEAHLDRALAHISAERYAEAARDLGDAARGRNRPGELLRMRGAVRILLKDVAGAVSDLEEGLRGSERDAEAWSNLGAAHLLAGRDAKALEALDRAVSAAPTREEDLPPHLRSVVAAIYANRGFARFRSGDAAGAAEDLTASLRFVPDEPVVLDFRGRALGEKGAGDRERARGLRPGVEAIRGLATVVTGGTYVVVNWWRFYFRYHDRRERASSLLFGGFRDSSMMTWK